MDVLRVRGLHADEVRDKEGEKSVEIDTRKEKRKIGENDDSLVDRNYITEKKHGTTKKQRGTR